MSYAKLGEPQDVFPFFVGSGRSGTTLVRAMFDSHPELTIPGESGFITRLGRRACKRYGCNGEFRTEVFLTDVLAHPRFSRWHVDEAEVKAAVVHPEVTSYSDAIRRVYSAYARSRGKRLYGDKTPVYVMHIKYLAELFPEARFVHVIRDGRDVALSHLSISEWGPGTLEEAAQEWRQSVHAGRRAGKKLEPGRYVELRYEELVDDAEGALRPVCQALSLDFDKSMLTYFKRVESILDPEYHPHHHRRIGLPPTTKLRDWRTQMGVDDVVRFEALAGPVLEEFGYERSQTGVSAADRVQGWSRLLARKSRRVSHRVLRLGKRMWVPQSAARKRRMNVPSSTGKDVAS